MHVTRCKYENGSTEFVESRCKNVNICSKSTPISSNTKGLYLHLAKTYGQTFVKVSQNENKSFVKVDC